MKTFETAVLPLLKASTETLIDPFQFAYRTNRSTDNAINIYLELINNHLDKPDSYARIRLLDFSSAFNTVSPQILQKNLATLEVHPTLRLWITDFLIPLALSSMCGSPVVSSRIVGGTDAVDGAWPWQIVLYYNGRFLCGGSLIAPQWIMSAAHCFQGRSTAYYRVYLGLYQLDVASPHTVTRTLIHSIVNSQYTSTGEVGDIALAQLSSPVNYTDYIMPICLPSSSVTFPSGLDCWVTGWGTTSSGGSLPVNGTLQEVMTPLIDSTTCDSMYHINSSESASTVIVQSDTICSGYTDGGKDSCQGDSGGPLVCKVGGVWYEAGIVSWGEGCAEAYRPGVYTLVTAYQAWISSYVQVPFYNVTNMTNILTQTTTTTATGKPRTTVGGIFFSIINPPSPDDSEGICAHRPHWTLLILVAFLLING
ncbi:serine protease 33-like [Hyperolius riggenbachi]|uniref:serine protease 33-like n=1 Tax=Hyperolius riggenbachi TaxID=752182 RepID=UPI0035A26CED